MDYKRIIRSRQLRIRIMQFLRFLPDEFVVLLQYQIKTGRRLNLNNPKRYTEKLQWYKTRYRDPQMKQCVDKYHVRNYLKNRGFGHLLNECFGVFDNISDIDFDSLPEKFVCKDTLGGGSTSVIVVDKRTADLSALKERMQNWLSEPIDAKHPGREWVYDGQKHRIVIEKYLEQSNGDLADYKFYCFDGKMSCFYVRTDYARNHDEGKMAFFDREKVHLAGVSMDYCKSSEEIPALPAEIDEMISYAEAIARGFPHVRVDFYDIDGTIVFGEMTFFNASGYMSFEPDEFDYQLGKEFRIPY